MTAVLLELMSIGVLISGVCLPDGECTILLSVLRALVIRNCLWFFLLPSGTRCIADESEEALWVGDLFSVEGVTAKLFASFLLYLFNSSSCMAVLFICKCKTNSNIKDEVSQFVFLNYSKTLDCK